MTPNLNEFHRRLDLQDELLKEIRTTTRETNGRVKKLELWQAKIEGARQAISWIPPLATALASGALGAIITSLLT